MPNQIRANIGQGVGAWQPVETKEGFEEEWAFTKAGDKLYQLVHTEEKERKAAFEAQLFKLREHLFLEL